MTVDGRRVVVTGAGGFIGSHLVQALVRAGAEVRALVRYTSRGEAGALRWLPGDVAGGFEVVRGDLRDVESVAGAVGGCEVVFHLGAQIAVPYSFVNPRDFFETNVLGTMNVARAAVEHGAGRLVHMSTSEVYGGTDGAPIDESHPLRARSPYAASKIGADKVVESWGHAFALPAVTVRAFNTYGPRQSARALVPTIITQALAGDGLRLGSLEPRRDLLFVEDTVAGLVAAASVPEATGTTVQLGTGVAPSVGDVVDAVGRILGRPLVPTRDEARIRPPDAELDCLLADPSRARDTLGWAPAVDLDEGLRRTIAWIDGHRDAYEPERYAV